MKLKSEYVSGYGYGNENCARDNGSMLGTGFGNGNGTGRGSGTFMCGYGDGEGSGRGCGIAFHPLNCGYGRTADYDELIYH